MPRLAFAKEFFSQLPKLQRPVLQGVTDAYNRFERLTLKELFRDPGLNLESLTGAKDKQIRTIRISRKTRGVVLAPESGDTYVLLRVLPHDKANAWAVNHKASINSATGAVEIRDEAALDAMTHAYESIAPASEERLFAKFSDKELRSLGIDEDTLRHARVLTNTEQLAGLAPYFPQDQREVLEFLAVGCTVEEVWRELVSQKLPSTTEPAGTDDYETAIRNSRARIAFVDAEEELRDILEKPFAAWRIFLHPSQRKVAYRPRYSGSAQVTGGPGTGKTVVALHRVRHLLNSLQDGERILLTTYTKALVSALRNGLEALVDDPAAARERVDITTVDAFAARVLAEAPGAEKRRPLIRGEESRWEKAARVTGCTATPQFLSQEYRHVVLAQNLRSLDEYEACERRGRGSALAVERRAAVWRAIEEFTSRLAADGYRTWLQTSSEAAELLETWGPVYRHVVVDEAQDLHPAQWRMLRAAVPVGPDDLFIAGDPHQRIYDAKVSLKELGIKVVGRSTRLRRNYRSTHEILRWSTALMAGRTIAQLEDEDRDETLLGYRSALHGSGPTAHAAESETAELDALVLQLRAWAESGVRPGEIGVCTRFNKSVDAVLERLQAANIPAVRLRADDDGETEAVRVGTMHSFKGLEFRCVAVTGVDDKALPLARAVTPAEVDRIQHETDMTAERCLLFVACTRARDSLYVSWSGVPSPFLTEAGAA